MADVHLSDEELSRFEDGELPQAGRHLETCPQCAGRLQDLRTAVGVYAGYRDTLRIPPPPNPWRSLSSLAAASETGPARRAWSRRWYVAGGALAACLVLAAIF